MLNALLELKVVQCLVLQEHVSTSQEEQCRRYGQINFINFHPGS